MRLRINQKARALKVFSPVFSDFIERFGLSFAGDKNVILEELSKQVVDALQLGHPGLSKMLADGNIFWWFGLRKDIEDNCSTYTACMSSGKILKHQFHSTEKINLPVLTESGQEIKLDIYGELHKNM